MMISNRIPPTSISRETRSSTCAIDRDGGQANSRGITDQSLASTIGIRTSPSPTCRPWLSRYSHDGSVGQSNVGNLSQPTSRRDGLAELRSVRDVGQQPGDRHDRQADQQHRPQDRRQPQAAQRAAPSRRSFAPRAAGAGPDRATAAVGNPYPPIGRWAARGPHCRPSALGFVWAEKSNQRITR